MSSNDRLSTGALAIAVWGVLGVLLTLAQALSRLTPIAIDALMSGLPAWQWVICGVWVIVNAYAEGYRGFHKSFSPRVVARAVHLGRNPRPLFVLLAPLYCMALFHASRKRLIVAWVLVIFIVAVVVGIRYLPQPWRGIVDAGVVVGLVWGALSIVMIAWAALVNNRVPEDDSQPLAEEAA